MAFTSRDWFFAFKVALAALLAMGIAFWVDLPRPYWAVTSVYMVSQPLSGATTSKAAYRLYGTILGAIAAVALVPNLVNVPILLCLAFALWIAGCLYFSLLDRTPRSYVLMLAGFTAPFVGFPLVNDPGSIFEYAVSRVEEIGLGIICAALVSSIVLPVSVVPMLRTKLDQWFHEAEDRMTAVFEREALPDDRIRQLHLACGAVAFDALITPLQHDISTGARFADAVATLRQHMLMFLPVVTAIHDRISALQKLNALPVAVRKLLDRMAAEVRAPDLGEIRNQREALSKLCATLPEKPVAWTDLLQATLMVRIGDYLDLRQDTLMLRAHIGRGEPLTEPYAFQYTAKARTVRHHDQLLALLSAMAAVIAVLATSAFWIAAKWPDGFAAPMLASAACSLFAAQDDPVLQIMDFVKAAVIGTIVAAIYLFAILPLATSLEMVVIVFTPLLVLCGLLMTRPKTGIIGMGTIVVGFTELALQNSYRFDLAFRQAEAIVAGKQASLEQAQSDYQRYDKLSDNAVSDQRRELAKATADEAKAAYDQAVADRDLAKLNRARAEIRASVNGLITNMDLQPGAYVSVGRGVTALIDEDTIRVEGYFEETKLPRIKVGNAATVHLIGERTLLTGHVESIAGGIDDRERSSGSNLLANVNPTFSWVRLAQRIPVRIALDQPPKDIDLVAGRTATVEIKPGPGK